LIRRAALRAVGDFDESRFIEGHPLWLRIARDHRMVATSRLVAQKRFHGENASVVQTSLVCRDMLEVMVREHRHTRSHALAETERAASRDRAYQALRVHGGRADLFWVLARHPVAAPIDLLRARRRLRSTG
jgi:hypothetical protein